MRERLLTAHNVMKSSNIIIFFKNTFRQFMKASNFNANSAERNMIKSSRCKHTSDMFMKDKGTMLVRSVVKPSTKNKNLNIIYWQYMKVLRSSVVSFAKKHLRIEKA